MVSFIERFETLADDRSPFCLGLDPTSEILRAWGCPDTVVGLERFCAQVADSAAGRVALVKPQSAHFERLGPDGLSVLREVMAAFRAKQTLVLLDVKRGDIAETNAGYAQAFLGADSPYGADAVTVSPYLGFDALKPFLDRAVEAGAAVFVVVASSNPEGKALQAASLPDGRMVAEALADDIAAYNADHGGTGPAAAVVGATRDDLPSSFFERLGGALVLAPGLGAQGAEIGSLPSGLQAISRQLIPSASRSLLKAGPDRASFLAAIDANCEAARPLRN